MSDSLKRAELVNRVCGLMDIFEMHDFDSLVDVLKRIKTALITDEECDTYLIEVVLSVLVVTSERFFIHNKKEAEKTPSEIMKRFSEQVF